MWERNWGRSLRIHDKRLKYILGVLVSLVQFVTYAIQSVLSNSKISLPQDLVSSVPTLLIDVTNCRQLLKTTRLSFRYSTPLRSQHPDIEFPDKPLFRPLKPLKLVVKRCFVHLNWSLLEMTAGTNKSVKLHLLCCFSMSIFKDESRVKSEQGQYCSLVPG